MACRRKVVLGFRRAAPLQDPRRQLRAAGLVSGHRRYAGAAGLEEGAGCRLPLRPSPKAEPVEIHLGPGLGDPGRRRPCRDGRQELGGSADFQARPQDRQPWQTDLCEGLLRVVRGLFGQGRLLLDTWFMRASVITFALDEGLTVIGQVRKDLALYLPPPTRHAGQRGRPPKYGAKMTEQAVATLKETRSFMFLYGQGQIVRYRSAVVLAKFLGGRAVRAVRIRLEDENGLPKAPRLLISTEITMTAREIIDAYALRWTIEPMFCALKHGIGVKETWQRRRQTLHRWVQILSTAFALTQMMAVYDPAIARQLAIVAPWRKERHPTAGMVKRGLAAIFRNVSLLAVWDRKYRKFSGPIAPHPLERRNAA